MAEKLSEEDFSNPVALSSEWHDYLKRNNPRYKVQLWKIGRSCGYTDKADVHYVGWKLATEEPMPAPESDYPLHMLREFYSCMSSSILPPPHVYKYVLESLGRYFEKPQENRELSKAFKLPPLKQKGGSPVEVHNAENKKFWAFFDMAWLQAHGQRQNKAAEIVLKGTGHEIVKSREKNIPGYDQRLTRINSFISRFRKSPIAKKALSEIKAMKIKRDQENKNGQ